MVNNVYLRVVAVVMILVLAAFISAVVITGWELARTLNDSRAEIAKQTQDLEAQVDRALAYGWRDMAERHLSDYQLGRIDEKMDSIGDYQSQWNHRNVAAEIYSAIHVSVQDELMYEGDYPVTPLKVRERIYSYHQTGLLQQLSSESMELPSVRADALVAADLEQCLQIQKKLEARRQAILPLLAKVSR